MQLASGGDMLNFGYWTPGLICTPNDAQRALCSIVAKEAQLESKRILDIGSGLCAPAMQWKSDYENTQIFSVNINFNQLSYSKMIQDDRRVLKSPPASSYRDDKMLILEHSKKDLSFVTATSTDLPFSDRTVDVVIALESAQHFRPLEKFVIESNPVLVAGGSLILAMPVLSRKSSSLGSLFKLGILALTWSSEHYHIDYVKSAIQNQGLEIASLTRIGHNVYEPLADYYIANRESLREKIIVQYP